MDTLDLLFMFIAVLSLAGTGASIFLAFCNARRQRPATGSDKSGESADRCLVALPVKVWIAVGAACTFVLIGAVAALIWRYTGEETNVNIISPAPGDEVGAQELVRGESAHVPGEHTIWVLIAPHDSGTYYPQQEVNVIADGGDWSTPGIFGAADDSGRAFDILAVLADADAYDDLKAHIVRHPDDMQKPGLDELPDGVKIYDRVSVVRP